MKIRTAVKDGKNRYHTKKAIITNILNRKINALWTVDAIMMVQRGIKIFKTSEDLFNNDRIPELDDSLKKLNNINPTRSPRV
jgi:hypothetical protein